MFVSSANELAQNHNTVIFACQDFGIPPTAKYEVVVFIYWLRFCVEKRSLLWLLLLQSADLREFVRMPSAGGGRLSPPLYAESHTQVVEKVHKRLHGFEHFRVLGNLKLPHHAVDQHVVELCVFFAHRLAAFG